MNKFNHCMGIELGREDGGGGGGGGLLFTTGKMTNQLGSDFHYYLIHYTLMFERAI